MCRSTEDALAAANRMHAVKCAYRKSIGYTTAAELKAIQGRELNEREREVVAALERARAESAGRS